MPAFLSARRASCLFLCTSPFLASALVAVRALRVPVLHVVIGIAVFAMFATAIWKLGGRTIRSQNQEIRLAAMSGMLLVLPFAMMALFWVGLGPPWVATAPENQMRYVVLVTMAAAVVGGFTYASAAAFASSLCHAGWLGRRAAAILVVICIVLAGCLVMRGLQFPDPAALSAPWYTVPGIIAGTRVGALHRLGNSSQQPSDFRSICESHPLCKRPIPSDTLLRFPQGCTVS